MLNDDNEPSCDLYVSNNQWFCFYRFGKWLIGLAEDSKDNTYNEEGNNIPGMICESDSSLVYL